MGKNCKLIVLAVFAMTVIFYGVSSATVTSTIVSNTPQMFVYKVTWGPSATTFTQVAAASIDLWEGWLYKVVTDPATASPTDNYDIQLLDSNGVDIFGAQIQNRDETNTEEVYIKAPGATDQWTPVYVNGPATFSVYGVTDADSNGDTFLYIRKQAP